MERRALKRCMKLQRSEKECTVLLQFNKRRQNDAGKRVEAGVTENNRFAIPFANVRQAFAAASERFQNAIPEEKLECLKELYLLKGQLIALRPFVDESESKLIDLRRTTLMYERKCNDIENLLRDLYKRFDNSLHLLRKYPKIAVENLVELAFVKKYTNCQPVYVFPLSPEGVYLKDDPRRIRLASLLGW